MIVTVSAMLFTSPVKGQAVSPAVPKHDWITRRGALLCANYFALKDAKAALAANDPAWFAKTGCVQAAEGLKVVLIEADIHSNLTWKGHVYPTDGSDGVDVYFDPYQVFTYAFATVPQVVDYGWLLSSGKSLKFKTAAEGEKWYTKIDVYSEMKKDIPHTVMADGDGFTLILGPAPFAFLNITCRKTRYITSTPAASSASSHPDECALLPCRCWGELKHTRKVWVRLSPNAGF
jgi:hypothetical protein